LPVFSFFNNIFISENTFNGDDSEKIIAHEKVHISQLHSFDLLFAELVCIIQWFNPFAYLLKKAIRENHEFLADQEVISAYNDPSTYRLLLLTYSSGIKTNSLAHNFSYSLLKRRLNMINKPKRPIKIGIALFGVIVALGFVLFACSTPTSDEQITRIEKSEIEMIEDAYTVAEVMPEYTGGMDSMIAFLRNNIKYPALAKENGEQGKVVVNFIVEKDGTISNAKILTGVSGSCDEEALRVVKSMPEWKPGIQEGKAVRVSFNLPINFKLDADTKDEPVFEVVKQMPEYPGGEEALFSFIGKNINYPEQAKKEGIQGRVYVSFIVEKNGKVSNVEVLKGIGNGCDAESLRVVKSMPNWKPGIDENGKPVRVKYNLPIKFALN
jgi:TonB family protein